jgi:tRNA uridine 5-carbamoylmethylation protein Kti12
MSSDPTKTISWNIPQMTVRDTDNHTNVVLSFIVQVTMTDLNSPTADSSTLKSCIKFNIEDNFSDSNFIAYENLTEENVIDWAKQHLNETSIEADLSADIDLKRKNLRILNQPDLPWNI